jgi:3-oxoacyl-[acyl-carrier-protein] synthase II
MEKRRVVITGLGAITPLGLNAADSWTAAKAGRCGIDTITLYDHSAQKVHLAAEAHGFAPEDFMEKKEARKMDRFTQFALAAANEAMANSGLDMAAEDAGRCGVLVSSGIGGLSTLEREIAKGAEKGYDRISPFYIPMSITNLAAGHIAIRHGFKGMCSCVVAACAGGSNAVGDAFRHIRDGYAEVMLCGGAEAAITPSGIGGFTSMHALTTCDDPVRASIPFDQERSGFVMGEGAAILILEELEHAQKRGARIIAEVVGYGATCDAYHITAPTPDGSGAASCMAQALEDAGVAPEAVGYINAHGTSTPLNDSGETAAIKTAFGSHACRLLVSSTKSMTGHLLGASGAVEAMFTALALRDSFAPPTIHYQIPDPSCDLDIVPNEGRSAALNYAMSNSLGFGGHNVSLLFKRWED